MKTVIVFMALMIAGSDMEMKRIAITCDERECRIPIEHAKAIAAWQGLAFQTIYEMGKAREQSCRAERST